MSSVAGSITSSAPTTTTNVSVNEDYRHSFSLIPNVSSYTPTSTSEVMREVVRQSAAAICFIQGFDHAQPSALESICEIMRTYIAAVCEQTKAATEVAGRTKTIPTDTWLALINMGVDVQALPDHLNKATSGQGTLVIPGPKQQPPPQNPPPLHVGRTKTHPQHVNDFLPKFPDPHTYIRTEISGEPDTSYEKLRDVAARRKRDTERSLVDFMLRIHPRICLFRDYETRARESAHNALADRERQKEARRAARRHARATRSNRIKDELPCDPMEDDILANSPPMGEQEKEASSDDDIEQFDLEDTETSLVMRQIPTFCSVLEPSLESRPYLSALVSEELADDDTQDAVGKGPGPEVGIDESQVYDNAFLRPPRMPQKDDDFASF